MQNPFKQQQWTFLQVCLKKIYCWPCKRNGYDVLWQSCTHFKWNHPDYHKPTGSTTNCPQEQASQDGEGDYWLQQMQFLLLLLKKPLPQLSWLQLQASCLWPQGPTLLHWILWPLRASSHGFKKSDTIMAIISIKMTLWDINGNMSPLLSLVWTRNVQ